MVLPPWKTSDFRMTASLPTYSVPSPSTETMSAEYIVRMTSKCFPCAHSSMNFRATVSTLMAMPFRCEATDSPRQAPPRRSRRPREPVGCGTQHERGGWTGARDRGDGAKASGDFQVGARHGGVAGLAVGGGEGFVVVHAAAGAVGDGPLPSPGVRSTGEGERPHGRITPGSSPHRSVAKRH